jgi:hypothetical protein
LPERDFYLSNVLNINKKAKYLIVRRAGLHRNLVARQPNLVVPGKRTVLSVEPWTTLERDCVFQLHECLAQLVTENLDVTRWLFKLDDEFDGRGIAYLDIAEHLPCYAWAVKVRNEGINARVRE